MFKYNFTTEPTATLGKLTQLLESSELTDSMTGYPNQKKMIQCGDILLEYLNETNIVGIYAAISILNIQRSSVYGGPLQTINIWKRILDTIKNLLPPNAYLAKVNLGIAIHFWGSDIHLNIKEILSKIQMSLEQFNLDITFDDKPMFISLASNIGYVVYPHDTGYQEKYHKLREYAALSTAYFVKDDFPSTLTHFNMDLYSKLKHKIQLETLLFQSIKDHSFDLSYQPQIDVQNHTIIGAEAFLNWNLGPAYTSSTQECISIIEESRFIIDFTVVSFSKLITFIQNYKHLFSHNFHVSFNLSRAIFKWAHFDLIETLNRLLKNQEEIIKYIQIEITESTYLSPKNCNKITDTMQDLHNLGFSIAIDDFGSGYGSLKLITSNIPDVIKLDKSMTDQLCNQTINSKFIRSLIFAAKESQFKIIVEGVETHEQEKELLRLGLKYAQGFKYAKNLSEKDFIAYLTQSSYSAN